MERVKDDDFRTVECLRGRLLAERVVSRAAKEEADLMTKRLLELERLLAMEIRCRNKAERRLKWALKRLESLKLVDDLPGISVSSKEILGESLGISSPTYSSCSARQEQKGSSHMEDPKQKIDGVGKGEGGSSKFSVDSTQHSASENESWSSAGTAHSVNGGNVKFGDFSKSKYNGQLELIVHNTSSTEHEDSSSLDDYAKENPLALVPANMWPVSGKEVETADRKFDLASMQPETDGIANLSSSRSRAQTHESVRNVLFALQRAKEQLQSSTCYTAIFQMPRRNSHMVNDRSLSQKRT